MIYIRTRCIGSHSAPGTHDGENCLIARVSWRIHNRDDNFLMPHFQEIVLSNKSYKIETISQKLLRQ